MSLQICKIVVFDKDNILTKFRANPMHVVHVVHARGACTIGRKLFWAIFFEFLGLIL